MCKSQIEIHFSFGTDIEVMPLLSTRYLKDDTKVFESALAASKL